MGTKQPIRSSMGRPARTLAGAVALLGCTTLTAVSARAADVTFERLLNPEPQNWLMNHRDFGAQRLSPLDAINKSNVKNMKLLFCGRDRRKRRQRGAAGNAAGRRRLHVHVRSAGAWSTRSTSAPAPRGASSGRWTRARKSSTATAASRCGAILVISVTGYDGRVIATDKETGKIVWDKNLRDQPDMELTAAPLALKDSIIIGASGGDRGVRDWIASLDAKTGELQWKTYYPGAGRARQRDLEGQEQRLADRRRRVLRHRLLRPATNTTYWGSGNPVPGYDSPAYRPGDNLYTNSLLAIDAATGKFKWHFQYTPNDNRDYDETGTHILIDTKVNGEDRKIVSHAGRNGFNYSFDRTNGQFLKVGQHVGKVTWTKGIDPKTGKPVDYDPTRDVQIYAEPANVNDDKATRNVCPDNAGGTNYWPAAYSPKTKFVYIPELEGCADITPDYFRDT